jgi:hypothetical protein
VIFGAFVIVFPAVVCGAASEALNRVDRCFASRGRGVVAEHVATGALDQRRAIAAMDERNLAAKHINSLFGGTLGDQVTVVNVCDEDGGGVLPRKNGVTLPVRGGANECVGEAGVGDECKEEVFRGPDQAIFVNSGYITQLGPRPTARRYQVRVRSAERFAHVTDLQEPPSERTPEEKLWEFKTRAQQYARDRESCDDVRISYLEFLETEAEDDLALARMIAG